MITAVILSATSPQPSASAAVLAYDRAHHDTLQVAGCLGFAASLPLAIWAAAAYRRLRTSLGLTAPGAVIGLAGGLLAAQRHRAIRQNLVVQWRPRVGFGLPARLAAGPRRVIRRIVSGSS